jgi:hypothetical protein
MPAKHKTDMKLTVILGLALGVVAAIPVGGVMIYRSRKVSAPSTSVSAVTSPAASAPSTALTAPSPAAHVATTPAPVAPAVPVAASKWEYTVKPDEMTGAMMHTALLKSDNQRNLSFPYQGGTHGGLAVTNTRQGKIAIGAFVDRGSVSCIGGCSILARFDDKPPVSYQGDLASGSTEAILMEPNNLILDAILSAKTLKLELPLIQEGRHVFDFTVSDFPPELRQFIMDKRK